MEFVPPGLMEGVFSSFGQYNECLDVVNTQGLKFRGQYCLAKFPLPFLHPVIKRGDQNASEISEFKINFQKKLHLDNNLMKLVQAINYFKTSYYRFGVCIPSVCNPKEINRALNKSEFQKVLKF